MAGAQIGFLDVGHLYNLISGEMLVDGGGLTPPSVGRREEQYRLAASGGGSLPAPLQLGELSERINMDHIHCSLTYTFPRSNLFIPSCIFPVVEKNMKEINWLGW